MSRPCLSITTKHINSCKNFVSLNVLIKISLYQTHNFCANAMAKLGSMLEQDFILFTAPPPLLFPLLEFDKKGLFCNRHCTVTLVT